MVKISLVENIVFYCPDNRMKGWRNFRVEYGGHAENCITEGSIWLPPHVAPNKLENLLMEYQNEG